MIVLDCCAAAEMARETLRGNAFLDFVEEGEEIISSDIFKAEIRNAFWKYVNADIMTKAQAEYFIGTAIALVDEFVPIEENIDEAFAEAVHYQHSVYGMLYLTLARRNNAILFTADKKLSNLAEDLRISCTHEVKLEDD